MESAENQPIRGSGVSVYKSTATKHTVTHLVVFDPRFSDPKPSGLNLNAKCRGGYDKNNCSSYCRKNCFVASQNQVFGLGPSGMFTAESDGEVIWRLDIDMYRYNAMDDLSTYRYKATLRISSKPKDVGVNFFAALRTKLTESFFNKPASSSYTVIEPGQAGPITTNFAPEFQLDDDNKKFRLDLTYFVYTKDNSEVVALPAPMTTGKPGETFPISVAALLENPVSSDITLEVNGKKWHLHKWILSVRSPVFAAMFSADMKEKNQDTIVYDQDVDKEAFDTMIKYIYTNDPGDLEEDTAISVLFLSDRFDLPGLKEYCEVILSSRINVQNCLTFFLLAEKCLAKLLKTVSESIILTNFSTLSKTEKWKDFAQKNFEQSLEIVRKI